MNDKAEVIKSSPQVFYEVVMNRLGAQMERIEAVDRKVSSIIGFASIIIAVFTAALQMRGVAQISPCVFVLLGLAGASYIALVVFALRAYRFRKWDFRPNLETLSEYYMRYDELTMKQWVARECITSYRENEAKLSNKTSKGRIAMCLLAVETTLLIVAALLALAHT